MMSDVRATRELLENILDLADYGTEVTKEDVTVLKDDWLTDNVCTPTTAYISTRLTAHCR